MKLVKFRLITNLILITQVLDLSHGKSDSVRVCVAANPNVKSLHTVKNCEQLALTKKTRATCVYAADRLECLRLVSERRADLTLLQAEDLLFAASSGALCSVLVASEIRGLLNEPYEYEAVVVVRADDHVRPDLKGAKLCHPGWSTQDGRSTLFTQFLEERLAPQSCNKNLSLFEDRLRTSAAYFGSSCKAGVWSSDKEEDERLKSLYPSLCDACTNPNVCSTTDVYFGDGGAATCLNDGAGNTMWAKFADVRLHFKASITDEESGKKYRFLCRDGTTEPLNTKAPCIWLARPWPVIVANSKIALDVQKALALLNDDHAQEWEENLLRVFDVSKEYIVNLETAKPPEDYLETIPGYVTGNDRTLANCNPRHEITWCTVTKMEMKKCMRIARAAAAYAVAPMITCVQRSHLLQCMKAVAELDVNVVIVPPDYQPIAVLNYDLEPMFYENFNTISSGYFLHAIVKRESSIKSLEDLRNKRACFGLYNGLAWRTVLTKLREAQLVTTSCSTTGILHNFFSSVCVTGGESDLPKCDSELSVDPEMDAFRSLASNECDVAFISNATVFQNTDGKNPSSWTNYLKSSDFRSVCSNQRNFECAWSWSAPSAIMTATNAPTIQRHETRHLFSELSRLFLRRSKSKSLVLSMFGPFFNEKNVIFQDGSSDLTPVERFNHHNYNTSSTDDIITATRYCSGCSTITAALWMVFMLIVHCLSSLYFIC